MLCCGALIGASQQGESFGWVLKASTRTIKHNFPHVYSSAFLCQVRNYQSKAVSRGLSQAWFPTVPKGAERDRFLPGSATLKTETRLLLLPEELKWLAPPHSAFEENWSKPTGNYNYSLHFRMSAALTGIKDCLTRIFPQYKPPCN